MIAQIVPLLKLPANVGAFSYIVPKKMESKITPGQIVEISFGSKKIKGLIIELKSLTPKNFKLKPINNLLENQMPITEKQINLIKFLAEKYFLSLTSLAKTLVPAKPSKKSLKLLENKFNRPIRSDKQTKETLFWYQKNKDLQQMIEEKCNQILQKKQQILILVPEISQIENLLSSLQLPTNSFCQMHSKIKKSLYLENWQDIYLGNKNIIIGTKISAFLPFKKLSEIIVLNEEDWNHKQSEAQPYFDARIIARRLKQDFVARLTWCSSAPSVETYNFLGKINSRRLKNSKNTDLLVVDLRQERMGGNYSLISESLLNKMEEKLTWGEKIFILHNRVGFAKIVSCRDCQHIFKCPKCAGNLAYENKKKQLFCLLCHYKEDVPPFCPQCLGVNLDFKGAGLQKIKKELEKKLPNVKIAELAKSEKELSSDYQIVIGTKFALNKIDLSNFSLIAFLNFDQLLGSSDFRANEKSYQTFYNISSQNPEAQYILQTNNPENFVVQSIIQNQPEIFYQEELGHRQNFSYPPFSRLIKLSTLDKNSQEKIAAYLKEKKTNWEILQSETKQNMAGKKNFNVIIKADLKDNLENVLTKLPKNVIIDINPEKIC